MYPVRTCEWEGDGDEVHVLLPRFSSELGRRVGTSLGVPSDYRVRLDRFGSFVWLQCDGSTTVRDIATRLRERFGDEIEPAVERLAKFLREMEQSGIISIQDDPLDGGQ